MEASTSSFSLASSALMTLTGARVPLAIGTLQWGTTWFDDNVMNRPRGCLTDSVCRGICEELTRGGVTIMDTAEGYGGGTSEKRLGRLLHRQEKQPQQPQPQTKLSNMMVMTKFLPVPWRATHASFERAVRQSCQRLQVDCIEVYLLHSPVHWRPVEFWVEAAAMCKRKGLLQSLGLSNANADQVRRAVHAGKKFGVDVVCNQVHYSLLDYKSEALQEMEQTCRELNVTIVAFTPIGQGLLTDGLTEEKYSTNKAAKMLRLSRDELDPLRNVITELAKTYQKTMAQVALNWCIQHQVVPLVGCRSTQQAKDSLGCLGWKLSSDDVERLDAVALDRSTLQSPPWRRAIFVTLFGIVNLICKTMDYWGCGSVGVEREEVYDSGKAKQV